MEWRERISIDPAVCHGRACIKGTRIPRFKVDENLPREACDLLKRAGHDATGVGQQGLGGADDARIYQVCQDEQRALLTPPTARG